MAKRKQASSQDEKRTIDVIRAEIDQIDNQIVELLNRRAQCTADIGSLKAAEQQTVFVPGREVAIFERLLAQNQGPLPDEALRNVFREIMSASKALQRGIHVAYLGPQATYTHQAALEQFGHMAEYLATQTIAEIFAAVESKRVDYGVVPVENSNEGIVNHTLDLFVDSPLLIYAEIYISISHSLLSRAQTAQQIKVVCSHPQALAQCRTWLELNLPQAELRPTHSTADAALQASRAADVAAIASPTAAHLYDLNAIQSGLGDHSTNETRFLVIGRKAPARSKNDITSLLFSIKKDNVGALYHALRPFAENQVNLTRIESRPTKLRAWEYIFFCDLVGHIEDSQVTKAVADLRPTSDFVKILGSYPRAKRPGV